MSKIVYPRLLAFAIAINCTFPAAATVFKSSVAVSSTPFDPQANYDIQASTEPNFGGDGADLDVFADTQRVLRPINGTLGIGHRWYHTLNGTAISPSFVMSTTPFAEVDLGAIDFSGRIQMPAFGGSFLMGFWLDATNDGTPGLGDCFGWARLSYTTTNGLRLLDNAIENSGAGIIVGTTNVVPEPSSLLLLALSLGIGFARRRTRDY